MDRACWIVGLVLIWVSVAVIPVGTHFQSLSPRFAEFERGMLTEIAGTNGEERLNPAGRMALDVVFTWQYACCFSVFIACLFTAGVLVIQAIGRWQNAISLLAAGVFGLGCLAGAVLGLGEAMQSFHWGFVTLGVGFLLSAAGLSAGGMGTMWSQWVQSQSLGTRIGLSNLT